MRAVVYLLAVLFLAAASSAVVAQDKHVIDPMLPGSLNPKPLPPLTNPNAPSTPAKELFAQINAVSRNTAFDRWRFRWLPRRRMSLQIAGARPGKSCGRRARNWGHPQLIRFIERLAADARKVGWNGPFVAGDMSQPRGGPMLSEHTSHQIGLDVDIWFAPMPDHVQSREERELGPATDVVAPDLRDVDPECVDPQTYRADPNGCAGSGGRPHLGQCRDQEGAVPRGLELIALGFTRCVPGMVTPSIFMSKSPVRQTVRNASRQPRRSQATAAVASSTSGSRNRRCIRRRANRNRF